MICRLSKLKRRNLRTLRRYNCYQFRIFGTGTILFTDTEAYYFS